ncbi:MAG: alpha/beta hydrolase [Myxococcota bacterium]|nr:alpha/beta hydrolase [Myxococcota bacterium]
MSGADATAGWIFLGVASIGAVLAFTALLQRRQLGALAGPYFFGAWLTGELALHHLAWQALATLVFAAFGAFASTPGIVGLGVAFVGWGALLSAHLRAESDPLRVDEPSESVVLDVPRDVSAGEWLRPFRMRRPGVTRLANVAYSDPQPRDRGRRNLLDVVMPEAPGEGRPALVQIHGGGWVIGNKEEQAQPLMHHMAERGWVCFAPNYRLSRPGRMPDPVVDVKRAIAWVREHADDYGVDPEFVCITGGSAGGHLAALAALSAGDGDWQPGFEHADTSVAACVPFYGVYDFLDRQGIRGRQAMQPFLSNRVFPGTPITDGDLWERCSPISRVHAQAPPFLVIHGTHDSLVFVEEARAFVDALREKSQSPVAYLESQGAQHAFDTFHSVRSVRTIRAVAAFLSAQHEAYLDR